MNHYFTQQEQSQTNRREIPFRFFGMDFKLISSDAIFSKNEIDRGTLVLLEQVLQQDLQGSVLDLGCGIGVVGIVLKMRFPEVSMTMSDITNHAIELAKENVKQLSLDVTIVQSDGFQNIPEKFDAIVLNPPIRAGKKVIYRLFEESIQHLKPNGKLYLVMMKKHGLDSAIDYLKTLKTIVTKIGHRSNYHVIEVGLY